MSRQENIVTLYREDNITKTVTFLYFLRFYSYLSNILNIFLFSAGPEGIAC